jgi:hypothetical protein
MARDAAGRARANTVSEQKRRQDLEEFLRTMPVEERRRRIVLEPAFRDAYNEITEAHRQFPVSEYLWRNWLPLLGPTPLILYIQLRKHCFYRKETAENRDFCWPKQETLAREIGVKNRKTVMSALKVLELHGFICSKTTRVNDPKTGHIRTGTKRYTVFFEVPLLPQDEVELLLRETRARVPDEFGPEAQGRGGGSLGRKSEKRTHGDDPVENFDRRSEKRTFPAVRKTDSKTSTRTNTINVNNVDEITYEEKRGRSPLAKEPAVEALTAEERLRREALVDEVGDKLKTLSGTWDGELHQSAGFHRRICFLMPEVFVREALRATVDAVDDQRAGRKTLGKGPGAYFAGAVKLIAKREGIELGVGWKRGSETRCRSD